jgi:molybdopterin molybdotransferase
VNGHGTHGRHATHGSHDDPTGLVGVEQHQADCLAVLRPLPPQRRALADASDRVLAEDVVAPDPLPGDDNSAMDGYAVRCSDVASASEDSPVVLPVVGDVAAGAAPPAPLAPGTAVRIMTGGLVPPGADGIVPVEQTDGGVHEVQVRTAATPGRFVRRAGEDVAAGETVLRAGTRLGPRHLALLAAVGRADVLVRGVPRVVVLSTGDEVVAPGGVLAPGQVFDSNGVSLAAAAAELGCDVRRVGPVLDDTGGLRAAIDDAVEGADVLITSGGVSAGAFDVVKALLRDSGSVEFRRVAVQPGMPQGVGVLGDDRVPVYCLPGNPVSSMVSFEVFVRPALRTLLGEPDVQRPVVRARAATGWRAPAGKRQFARVALRTDTDGATVCEPVGGQGSHLVADLAGADALAVVPEDVTDVAAGTELDCLLLERARR